MSLHHSDAPELSDKLTLWTDYVVNGAGLPVGTPLGDPALIEMISEDPILRNTKLIAEAWDCDGLNQIGAFPHYGGRWSEWNGQFRDVVRQFVKVWHCNVSLCSNKKLASSGAGTWISLHAT